MIPTIGGADNITWAQEQRAKRRAAIEETIGALIWIAVFLAMLAAAFFFGYANGAESKPTVELDTTEVTELPTLEQATAVLNHFNED